MAYVTAPPMSRGGLGLFDDVSPKQAANQAATNYANQLKAQAQQAGTAAIDASKQQAIDFASQQLASYPTAGAVAAQYNEYAAYLKQIPGFNPADLADPDKVVGLMQQALILYAQQNGIPTNTAEAKQALASYALSIASSEIGVPIPYPLPTNAAMLKDACINFACTSVMMQTGVDPKLATVTVECLLDGKISAQDCETIGQCAGSIAGAQVAMSVGIPAPIGAFVGGLAGTMVGGTVAEIFGLVDPQDFVRELEKAESDLEKAVLEEAQRICSSSRSMYWDAFDSLLMGTELQWRTVEAKIGWKFQLRWFGMQYDNALPKPSPFLRAFNPQTGNYNGPLTLDTRRAVLYSKNINYDVQSVDGTLKTTPLYGCPFDYGCPYPTTGTNLGAGLYERDAQAFFARGGLWIPPDKRAMQCAFPVPNGTEAFDEAARCRWLKSVKDTVNSEAAAISALQILSVTVIGDLIKTGAAVAAEKTFTDQLQMDGVAINAAGIKRSHDLVVAKKTGQQLSDLLNIGMLLTGVGVLGAALYKKSRP